MNEKKSMLINVLAWIGIIYGGLTLVGTVWSFVTLPSINYDYINSIINSYTDVSSLYIFYISHPILFKIIGLIVSLLFFFVSLGLLYRASIAWKGAIAFFCYYIITGIWLPLWQRFFVPSAGNLINTIPKESVSFIDSFSIIGSIFIGIISAIINLWLLYKFTSDEVKNEFIMLEIVEQEA